MEFINGCVYMTVAPGEALKYMGHLSCGSLTWVCSVLKFLPLVILIKKPQHVGLPKSSSAPGKTVIFMKGFGAEDLAFHPSSLS